jgi:hypothetical protein
VPVLKDAPVVAGVCLYALTTHAAAGVTRGKIGVRLMHALERFNRINFAQATPVTLFRDLRLPGRLV